jgi:hypothetical protein
MYLGIEESTGLVYEGSGNAEIPALPLPVVTQAMLIENEQGWRQLPGGLKGDPVRWVFREDSFDPITRIRRGRLYQPWGGSHPSPQTVRPHPYDDPRQRRAGALTKQLNVYATCSELLQLPRRGEGSTLALGGRAALERPGCPERLAGRALPPELGRERSSGVARAHCGRGARLVRFNQNTKGRLEGR